jgi:glyoxylase-like metal-dependent hydrolase (beta-lactamase superfamily II)
VQEIAQGVYYAPTFRGVNLGVVATEEGVALVDTPMLPSTALAWRNTVQAYGPIRYILNSDHLQEHVMGNAFLPGHVIAHEETRARMRMTDKAKEQYRKFVSDHDSEGGEQLLRDYEVRFPNITLFDALTVHVGGQPLEFIALPGHTSNSVGLFLPERGILFSGDVVVNGYRAYLGMSIISDWLETLKRIEMMDGLEWIIPGHGEPLHPEEIGPLSDYLERMRNRVQDLIDSGRARDEVVSKMMPFFEEWPIDNTRRDEERNLFRQGVRQLYDQLTGRK